MRVAIDSGIQFREETVIVRWPVRLSPARNIVNWGVFESCVTYLVSGGACGAGCGQSSGLGAKRHRGSVPSRRPVLQCRLILCCLG
jgi:hypothetical protein